MNKNVKTVLICVLVAILICLAIIAACKIGNFGCCSCGEEHYKYYIARIGAWTTVVSLGIICATVVICKLIRSKDCSDKDHPNNSLAEKIIDKMGNATHTCRKTTVKASFRRK